MQVSGIFPSLAQVADFGPPRSEIGIGALMPWNGCLYVQNYNSHKAGSGSGVHMRRINADMTMEEVEEARHVHGTYANRFVHFETSSLVLGPFVISARHEFRLVKMLQGERLCGTCRHPWKPDTHVYVLSMEGILYELDVTTLDCRPAFDLNDELSTEGEWKVHYKDCYSALGRVVVCSNEYGEDDWARSRPQRGRLAEFDGNAWSIIARAPFVGIGGRQSFGGTIFASGWDQASALLYVFTEKDKVWTRYRLPKASHCFDHKWQTEWPRIREVEHERLLLDHHGMFYELSPHAYGGRIWGVRPVSTHLNVLGDFCSYRGMFVAGADNASPSGGLNVLTAEPQSGLWFGKTDDLWSFGKPQGWGGPWWDEEVTQGQPSDPYLMTGFDNKCIHVQLHDSPSSDCEVALELDVLGHGVFARSRYSLVVSKTEPLATLAFPPGFSAHWVRLRLVRGSKARLSAQFFYT